MHGGFHFLKIFTHLSRFVVLDNTDLGKGRKPLVVDFHGVVAAEGFSAVGATKRGQDLNTTRMFLGECCTVIDFTVDGKPQVVSCFMMSDFFESDFSRINSSFGSSTGH